MLGDSLAISSVLHCPDAVVPTTDGGRVRRASSDMNRSVHVAVAGQRIDAAHGSPPKHRPSSKQDEPNGNQDDGVAPRRRPSFTSLLQSDNSPSSTQVSNGLNEERRHELYEASIAYDVGVFPDAERLMDPSLANAESELAATEKTGSPSIDDSGNQQVSDDSPLDSKAATKECKSDVGATVGGEDWLSLHAADLVRRMQDWADELSAREFQLMTRMSQQQQRERRFRALCEVSVTQSEENARHDC